MSLNKLMGVLGGALVTTAIVLVTVFALNKASGFTRNIVQQAIR